MKNYIYILAAALLLCPFAYSEEESTKQIESQTHRFYAGPDVFWIHEKTSCAYEVGRRDSTVNSVLAGLRLGYDYLKSRSFYFGMDGLAAVGTSFIRRTWTDYYRYGHSFLFPYPIKANQKYKRSSLFANIEQRYGYTFQSTISAKSTLIPFAGIGWYYIRPQFDGSYLSFNWFYGAAGLRMNQQFYESFDAGLNVKMMYAFAGNIENFWGYEVALPLTWRIGASEKWDFQFQPYLLKLSVNAIGYILGARLQAGYSF